MLLTAHLALALLAAAPSGHEGHDHGPQAAASCGSCDGKGGGACAAGEGSDIQFDGRTFETVEDWREYMLNKLRTGNNPEQMLEPHDPDPFAFSAYKGARPEPMGKQTIINGAQMDVASMIVTDPPHVVETEYLRAFEEAGLKPLRGEIPDTDGVRYLSYRPQHSQKLKTVTLVPNGRGTVILASVGDPSKMLEPKVDVPPGFPVPRGAEPAVAIRTDEPGASSRSTSFVVRNANVNEVRQYFRRELSARGFRPLPGAGETDSYESANNLISVTARPAADASAVSVSVVWIE